MQCELGVNRGSFTLKMIDEQRKARSRLLYTAAHAALLLVTSFLRQ